MTRRRKPALALFAALALIVALFSLSSCGYSSEGETEVVEGEPVELGELKYNVIFSRYLNRNDPEDSSYLVGQPQPPPDSTYFGVFFLVQNESKEEQRLADSLHIVDADHTKFEALSSDSLYAFPLGEEIEAEEQVPILDSTAQQGPIEGAVAIFLLPDFASENRPLILEIPGPDGHAEVALDL